MIQTLEAVVDQQGTLRLLDSIRLPPLRCALITVLDEEPEWSAPVGPVERIRLSQ